MSKPKAAARRAIKTAIAGGIYYSGILFGWQLLRRRLGRPRVHVLGFHRVVPDYRAAAGRALPALCISIEAFEAQLRYLREHMDVIDLGSALEALRGERRLRRDAAVITFDDGYRDTYTRAFPILRRLGLPAAVFVTTGYVDTTRLLPHDRLYAVLRAAARKKPRPVLPHAERWAAKAREQSPELAVELAARAIRHPLLLELTRLLEEAYGPGEPPDEDGHALSWSMCREMAACDVEIGSHTVSHSVLAHESRMTILDELKVSKAEIERRVGRPVRFLAYPNGVYSDAVMRACVEVGYQAALTTEDRPNRPGTNVLAIGRKLLWEAHGGGFGKRPSRALVASHLENVYSHIGVRHAGGHVPEPLFRGEALCKA
jgi:peptidoglycan/xylan/chitin deacetylase (PgdA/CDA1 family)